MVLKGPLTAWSLSAPVHGSHRSSRQRGSTRREGTVRYLGMDVHATSTVWCLLDGTGAVVARGRVATTTAGLAELIRELGGGADLVAGHEVGTMAYFVHDTLTAAGVRCLAFNAQHLRMIAASRKKTDRRGAYWIAKAPQSGMYPPPVYLPTGEERELRVRMPRLRPLHVEYGPW